MGREGHQAKLTLQGLQGQEKAKSIGAFLPTACRDEVWPAESGRWEAADVQARGRLNSAGSS